MTPTQIKALVHCLFEEHSANGGHFASQDTDIWFRQAFADDWGDADKTTAELLKELITQTNNTQ